MSGLEEVISEVVGSCTDPVMGESLESLGAVKTLSYSAGKVFIDIELNYPCQSSALPLAQKLHKLLLPLDGVDEAEIDIGHEIKAHAGHKMLPAMQGVKNIIAVASGKGGVGKSTTTVNLALAMAAEGASVGILDADIYGPSQGKMLGVAEGVRPQPAGENSFFPIKALGVQSMSMSYLIEDNTAMVWRGPMAAGALQQLVTQTQWDDLDYLFIDMPPGTGDIQLTLSQKVPVSGAVIVTTPQDIALLDAKKGIEMFRKVDIPVLGVLENMSTHVCSNCGHAEAIFGEDGGASIAKEYDTDLLGQLPLALSIREQADSGLPTVAAEPESAYAKVYRDVALKVAVMLAEKGGQPESVIPTISVVDD